MIIECVNCSKKFSVNADLIPSAGRTIQCGSCNHVWFYKKDQNISKKSQTPELLITETFPIPSTSENKKKTQKNLNYSKKETSALVKYDKKQNFTIGKFLSYLIVMIVSFVALLIVIDTFKKPLYKFFPELEFLLFSLFETIKDIILFSKNLIA